jgi:2-dehydropantoate 2-reductase
MIRDRAPRDALIISLQNGVGNVGILRAILPSHDVRAGVVSFNVAWLDDATLKRATSGPIVIEGDTNPLAWAKGLPVDVLPANPIGPVQNAKLLINLNNALNALSGLTLVEQFRIRGWRRLMRAQLREGLGVFDAEGAAVGRVGAADPRALAIALALPGPLFRLAIRGKLDIDPDARSSMQDDLRARRKTEIDELQGEIIRRAEKLGRDVPVTRAVMQRVHDAEGRGVPGLTPDAVMAR